MLNSLWNRFWYDGRHVGHISNPWANEVENVELLNQGLIVKSEHSKFGYELTDTVKQEIFADYKSKYYPKKKDADVAQR